MSELYARIEGLCKENGISVTQLCRETKINRSILTELKKGRTKYLSFETLRKISDYFKVPLDQFKETDMTTINKIISLLDEKDLNQKDLTDYLGISKSAFSAWKSGTSHSYNKYLGKIAEFLNTPPSELIGWTPKAAAPAASEKQLSDHRMKYELWDVYETEIFDTGEILCASDDMAEIRLAAKEHIRNTNGECRLFVKEWLDK